MTAKECYEKASQVYGVVPTMIGVYDPMGTFPEYADEFLETSGDEIYEGCYYSDEHDCLVLFPVGMIEVEEVQNV